MFDWQTILVIALVAIAAFDIARRFYRTLQLFRGSNRSTKCIGCQTGCEVQPLVTIDLSARR